MKTLRIALLAALLASPAYAIEEGIIPQTGDPVMGVDANKKARFLSVGTDGLLPTTSNDYTTTPAGTAAPLLLGVQGGGVGTLPIPIPDAGNLSTGTGTGTCATACNGTNLFSIETSGYGGLLTIQVTAAANTSTIVFQHSNDNATWTSMECNFYGRAGTFTTMIAATTGDYFCPTPKRYVRMNYTAYTNGTVTVFWNLRQNVSMPITLVPGVNYGTAIAGNGSGSTGAVVGTLTATAGHTAYICGFNVSAIGGTAAVGPVVVAGLTGPSQTYQGSASVAGGPVVAQNFYPCIPASAANTNITITTTADGSASAVNVNSWGFLL